MPLVSRGITDLKLKRKKLFPEDHCSGMLKIYEKLLSGNNRYL